jgi:ribosomal RNA-processing protein 36
LTLAPCCYIRQPDADPRFDARGGAHAAAGAEGAARKAYAFLEGYRDSEIAALQAELRKARTDEARGALKAALVRLQQQRGEDARRESTRTSLAALKREERAKVAAGKTPYFPKRRELKEAVAIQRFKELEARGDAAVSKAMRRRAKKVLGKQRKAAKLPAVRRSAPPPAAGGRGR